MDYYRMYCAELQGQLEPCHGVRFRARDIRDEVGGMFLTDARRRPCGSVDECVKECWRVAKSYGWRVVPVQVNKIENTSWPRQR